MARIASLGLAGILLAGPLARSASVPAEQAAQYEVTIYRNGGEIVMMRALDKNTHPWMVTGIDTDGDGLYERGILMYGYAENKTDACFWGKDERRYLCSKKDLARALATLELHHPNKILSRR